MRKPCIQNKDGAAGLVGTTYLGEVGPRDGTMVGYLTGAAWKYLLDPEQHRVDFRSYEFIGYSPGNANQDGSFRKIDLRTKDKNLKVQARTGYYASKRTAR